MSAVKPRFGAKLRTERMARVMTVRAMAEALRDSASERERARLPKLNDLMRMVRAWEADTNGLSERYQLLYCCALNMAQEELFGNESSSQSQPDSPAASIDEVKAGSAGATWEGDEDDVERRRMLQALAILGVASASPVADALQSMRNYVEKNLGRGIAGQLDDWEETVAEYGYAYLTDPPHRLVSELAADLFSVHSITPRIKDGHPQYSRWCRITGGLAALMAKTLCNLGQTRDARTWWSTAQHAADTSRDVDLSLWVTGERLFHGMYERRPTAVLLRQATTAAARASGRPSAGLAKARAAQAQLLALAGPARADEAVAELHRVEEVFVQLPAAVTQDVESIMCWSEDRLRYAEAWVYAHLGECRQLDGAVGHALEIYQAADRDRAVAQVKLLRAFGYVRSGDVTEGIKDALATYEEYPADQRTTFVTRLAGQVLEAVPAKHHGDPPVAAYRELLAVTSRKAIT